MAKTRRGHNLDQPAERRRVGWESLIPQPAGEPAAEGAEVYQRKTYLLTPTMVGEIGALAEDEGMPVNELVRFLLRHALDAVRQGEAELPGEVVTVKKRVIRG